MDLKEFLENDYSILVESIYDAALDASRWPSVFEQILSSFDAAGAIYVFDTQKQAVAVAASGGADEQLLDAYNKHFAHVNPYAPAAASLPVNRIVRANEVISTEIMKDTEFYNDFMRKVGYSLKHLAIKTNDSANGFAIIGISPLGAKFENDQREAIAKLDLLRPHLARAIELSLRVEEMVARSNTLQNAINALPDAAFVIDGPKIITHNNYGGELLGANELRPSDLVECARRLAFEPGFHDIHAAYENASRYGSVKRIVSRRSRNVYVASLVQFERSDAQPSDAGIVLRQILYGTGASILLVAPLRCDVAIPGEVLRDAFDLSLAEGRLVSALLGGQTVNEYAEAMGISRNTARNQLASVFAKTGTSRQAELVAQAARIAAILRPNSAGS